MIKLYRKPEDAKLAGICAGLAEIMGVDVTMVRLGLVLIALLTAVIPFVLVYFIAWWVIPVGRRRPAREAERPQQPADEPVAPPKSSGMSADDVISHLGLSPHPIEGGYFVETYRTEERVPAHILPNRYGNERDIGTAIYYLLKADGRSAMHKLASDEVVSLLRGRSGHHAAHSAGRDLERGDVGQRSLCRARAAARRAEGCLAGVVRAAGRVVRVARNDHGAGVRSGRLRGRRAGGTAAPLPGAQGSRRAADVGSVRPANEAGVRARGVAAGRRS